MSEKTVEENILKKANQKRLLGDLAIEGGNFTTAYFKSVRKTLQTNHYDAIIDISIILCFHYKLRSNVYTVLANGN